MGLNISLFSALQWAKIREYVLKYYVIWRNSIVTILAETGEFAHYLLTPCCRVLLEKLTGLQLVKKFPTFYGTRRFITALTSVRHEWGEYFTSGLFCLQRKHPACECFLTWVFYREGLLAPRPAPKLDDHPLSAVHDCLFNIFAATLHIGGRSSIRNLRTRHAVVT